MDYHKSVSDYSKTKFRLFNDILSPDKTSVICIDSNEGMKFYKKLKKLNRNIFDIGFGASKLNIILSERILDGHKVKILYGENLSLIHI